MDNAHPLSTPMVNRSLDVKKDPFRPQKDDEEIIGPQVSYLSANWCPVVSCKLYTTCIAFSVNLLARYSSAPTQRHWNRIKHILCYLCGTTDLRLFYLKGSNPQLIRYANARYLSDPHKG